MQTRSTSNQLVADANDGLTGPALIVHAGSYRCALPLTYVIETMRPLPIQPLADTPSFVRGAAIIRGEPIPVVRLNRLLGADDFPTSRFVVVRVGQRRVALEVEEVLGVKDLAETSLSAVPPLLEAAQSGLVDALGLCDEKLLVVLETARILPDEVWEALAREHARAD